MKSLGRFDGFGFGIIFGTGFVPFGIGRVNLLDRYLLDPELRGDGIYVVGRKAGPVKQRYPDWLYSGGEK